MGDYKEFESWVETIIDAMNEIDGSDWGTKWGNFGEIYSHEWDFRVHLNKEVWKVFRHLEPIKAADLLFWIASGAGASRDNSYDNYWEERTDAT